MSLGAGGLTGVILFVFVTQLACGRESGAAETRRVDEAAPQARQPQAITGDSSRFVAHDEYVEAGFPSRTRPLVLRNPYERDTRAIETGSKLFVAYNCMDCHGAEGSGAIGPSLQDGRWHFGGSPAELFESIYQGRPEGMPAWGGRISDEQIWMLVSYLRSLPTGKDISTENFTGKTVERSGH